MSAAVLAATCVMVLGFRLQPTARCRQPLAADTSSVQRRRRRPLVPLRTSRARPTTAGDVATWCDRLAGAIRSGSTLTSAVRDVSPPAGGQQEHNRIVLALDRGAPLHAALESSALSPHVELALVVLRACALNGGPSAEPIDRAAATLRARDADEADRLTQSAQARLSAIVMTVLPSTFLVVLAVTSPPVRLILHTPIGLVVVTLGGALNLIGWRWMRRLIDGHES